MAAECRYIAGSLAEHPADVRLPDEDRPAVHGPRPGLAWMAPPAGRAVLHVAVGVANVTSSGKWIQWGGTVGQPWSSRTWTPVSLFSPVYRPPPG